MLSIASKLLVFNMSRRIARATALLQSEGIAKPPAAQNRLRAALLPIFCSWTLASARAVGAACRPHFNFQHHLLPGFAPGKTIIHRLLAVKIGQYGRRYMVESSLARFSKRDPADSGPSAMPSRKLVATSKVRFDTRT
jgi:hypothetical protein